MRLPAFAGAAPFAHLLGPRSAASKAALAAASAAEDEEEKKAKHAAEDDSEEDEDDDDKKPKSKRAKAESDDDDDDDSDDDDDKKKKIRPKDEEDEDDDEDKVKSKKAKRADESSDDDSMKKAESRGRLKERARIERILGCKAAGLRPDLAAQLACSTGMNSSAAINLLGTMVEGDKRAARSGIADRMATQNIPNPGTENASAAAPDLAARIVLAGKKRRGEI